MKNIIKDLKMYHFGGEPLYKLDDLMKALNHHNGDLQLFDMLLTPFYSENGSRYEFLGDDLNITLVKEKNFNDHLLKLTSKSSIEEISPDIIERQKNCYLEYTIENDKIPKSIIEKYILYIY